MGNTHVTQTGQFWTTTNSVENSLSYEADTFSTNQQNYPILWNLKTAN